MPVASTVSPGGQSGGTVRPDGGDRTDRRSPPRLIAASQGGVRASVFWRSARVGTSEAPTWDQRGWGEGRGRSGADAQGARGSRISTAESLTSANVLSSAVPMATLLAGRHQRRACSGANTRARRSSTASQRMEVSVRSGTLVTDEARACTGSRRDGESTSGPRRVAEAGSALEG